MTQACIEMLEGTAGNEFREGCSRECAGDTLRALRAYLRVYPFSRGRYCLYFGMYRAVQGEEIVLPRRQWTRGLRFADLAGLQLDGARIRLLLAQQLPEGSPTRVQLQRETRSTLDELGLRRLKEFEDLRL